MFSVYNLCLYCLLFNRNLLHCQVINDYLIYFGQFFSITLSIKPKSENQIGLKMLTKLLIKRLKLSVNNRICVFGCERRWIEVLMTTNGITSYKIAFTIHSIISKKSRAAVMLTKTSFFCAWLKLNGPQYDPGFHIIIL